MAAEYIYNGTTYLPQSVETDIELYDNLIVDRSVAGVPYTRSTVPVGNLKPTFKVVHPVLTLEQKDWVIQFYKDNRDAAYFIFRFNLTGTNYNVKFVSTPKISLAGGPYYRVEFSVAEV